MNWTATILLADSAGVRRVTVAASDLAQAQSQASQLLQESERLLVVSPQQETQGNDVRAQSVLAKSSSSVHGSGPVAEIAKTTALGMSPSQCRAMNKAWAAQALLLIRSGMTPSEMVDTLRDQDPGSHVSRVSTELAQQLRSGQPLSNAMANVGVFHPVLVSAVRASEKTSDLAGALTEFERYDAMMQELRSKATSAAVYPAIVSAVGLVVSVFLLTFVMPRFAAVFAQTSDLQSAQGLSASVLRASLWLREHGVLVGASIVCVIVGASMLWSRTGVQQRLRKAASSLPGVRSALRHYWMAQLFQSLALLVRGGYPLVEAIAVVATMNKERSAELDEIRMDLFKGQSFSDSLALRTQVDVTTLRLLGVAERSGRFDEVLSAIASRYSSELETAINRASRLIEPVLLLLVAAMVGTLVVCMYMPIFDLAGNLG